MLLRFKPPKVVVWRYFISSHMLIIYYGYLALNEVAMVVSLLINIGMILRSRNLPWGWKVDHQRLVLVLVCITLLMMLPFSILKSNFSFFWVACGVSSALSAYIIMQRPDDAISALRNTLVASQILIIIFTKTTPEKVFPLDHMFANASSNGVTSFLVVLQATYLLVLFNEKAKLSILTTVVTLYICFLGFGRGSLVSAAILLFAVISFYIFLFKSVILRVASIFIICLLIFLLSSGHLEYAHRLMMSETKFMAGFFDEHRNLIYREYFSALNGLSLLFGASYSGMAIESTYNGNPHSSYIRMHHLFGLPYVIAIFIALCAIAFKALGSARWIFNFFIFVSLALRAASEPILFPTPLDIFFFIGVFGVLRGRGAIHDMIQGHEVKGPSVSLYRHLSSVTFPNDTKTERG